MARRGWRARARSALPSVDEGGTRSAALLRFFASRNPLSSILHPRITAALCLSLCYATAVPRAHAAEGEHWIPAYNKLAEMLIDRCLAAGNVNTNDDFGHVDIKRVASDDSVTQEHLKQLRMKVDELADAGGQRFVFQNTPADSSDPANTVAWPLYLNTNKWLKVPGRYTESGTTLYDGASFDDAPVLWEHFQDLEERLKDFPHYTRKGSQSGLKRVLPDAGEGTNNYYRGWCRADTYAKASAGALANWHAQSSDPGGGGAHAMTLTQYPYYVLPDWHAKYDCAAVGLRRRHAAIGLSPALFHKVDFWIYCVAPVPTRNPSTTSFCNNGAEYAVENTWVKLDSGCGYEAGITSKVFGCSAGTAPAFPVERTKKYTYYGWQVLNFMATVDWPDLRNETPEHPTVNDGPDDGLYVDGCGCGGGRCIQGEDAARWQKDTDGSSRKLSLGISSSAAGGIAVESYLYEYEVDGVTRMALSTDTRVLAYYSGTNAGGWEFVLIKRPHGAERLFSLKGTAKGPVDGLEKWHVIPNGSDWELHFGGPDNIVHRFDAADSGGHIKQVRKTVAHQELSVGVNGSYTRWPGMTTYLDASDRVSSNLTTSIKAFPSWLSNSTIASVSYKDADDQLLHTIHALDAHSGSSRVFRVVTSGGRTNERWAVTRDGTEQLWYGVTSEGGTNAPHVARKEIRAEHYDEATGVTLLSQTNILNPGDADEMTEVTVSVLKDFSWGKGLIAVTNGVGAADPEVTTYTYHTNSAEPDSYEQLELQVNSDGSWVRYAAYDENKRATHVLASFKNAATDASASQCRATHYYYAGQLPGGLGFPSDDQAATNDSRPRLVIERVLGQEVARTYIAYFAASNVTKRCTAPGASYSSAGNLVTVTECFTSGDYRGRPHRITYPDGTISLYGYGYDAGADELSVTNDVGSGPGTVTNGVRTITVQNAGGNPLSVRKQDIASSIEFSNVSYVRDAYGRVLLSSNSITGRATTNAYSSCCAEDSARDADGIWTTNSYNDLKQVLTVDRLNVRTSYGYDVHGNVLWTQKEAPGAPTIVTHSAYDRRGRPVAETNALGGVTTYAYATNAAGERIVTTTFPDGATRVETSYRDGQLKSVGGTAVPPTCYAHGVDPTGLFQTVYYGPNTNASEWVRTYTDPLGRAFKTVYPDGYEETTTFDANGRATARSDGLTTVLTEYNARGDVLRTATDMDGDRQIGPGGTDRISETDSGYVTVPCPAHRSASYIYPVAGSPAKQELGRRLRSVDGSQTWTIAFGRTNHSAVVRDLAHAARTETETAPDGTQAVSCYTNGLLTSVTRRARGGALVARVRYEHDGFGRVRTRTDTAPNGEPRTTTFVYDPAGNLSNTLVSVGTLVHSTTHTHDSMGRRRRTVLPDGGTIDYEYTPTGALAAQCGARTCPVSYTYDSRGRMATMATYRDGLGNSPDITRWTYGPKRGRLEFKIYADGSHVDYDYFPNGQLKTRTWARGATTAYRYDRGGSLTNITWSGAAGTETVRYTRDRLGRAAEIADAIGTRAFTYRTDGQLESETLPQLTSLALFGAGGRGSVRAAPGDVLEHHYDRFGRRTNVVLKADGAGVARNRYGYDEAGRIEQVSDGANTATYEYGPDRASVASRSVFHAGTLAMTVTNTYDGLGRLLEKLSSPSTAGIPACGSQPISYRYDYNDADQRTRCTLADGSYWRYDYDELGQVVAGRRFFSDGQPVPFAQFHYGFDTIGNRTHASATSPTNITHHTYTANELNQYTQRSVPGTVLFDGEAAPAATVSVRRTNELARLANRRHQYWWQWLDVDNTGAPVYSTNIVMATLAQGTNSLVARETKKVFTPEEPEQFEHDADGNLTRDGRFDYEWNANNRLIAVESRPTVPEHARTRLEFDYDHQGRRTRKTVLSACIAGAYTATGTWTYVYDGWNVIAEIRNTDSEVTTNTYLWGKDLSGSLQGAGGIGGLLSLSRSAQVERRVSDGLDDAEQQTAGSMYLDSTDLELLYDGATEQTVGMRFRSIAIPRGATITKAYVQFQVDEPDSGPTTVTIHGEDADDADAFSSATSNITARPLTTASVSWTVPAWVTPGEAGSDQQTEDISEIIQQIVDRDDWRSGNAMALIFSGSGERTAEAYEGNPSAAPRLHIEYVTDNYCYLYDGNGNIMALVNATDGSLAAEYEYGPFGEPLKATGPVAHDQPFRFSTKYTDPESGLVYYGFRYYDSRTGRWPNRDPVEEEGGLNLYLMVDNAVPNGFDLVGLSSGSTQSFFAVHTVYLRMPLDKEKRAGNVSYETKISCDAQGKISHKKTDDIVSSRVVLRIDVLKGVMNESSSTHDTITIDLDSTARVEMWNARDFFLGTSGSTVVSLVSKSLGPISWMAGTGLSFAYSLSPWSANRVYQATCGQNVMFKCVCNTKTDTWEVFTTRGKKSIIPDPKYPELRWSEF